MGTGAGRGAGAAAGAGLWGAAGRGAGAGAGAAWTAGALGVPTSVNTTFLWPNTACTAGSTTERTSPRSSILSAKPEPAGRPTVSVSPSSETGDAARSSERFAGDCFSGPSTTCFQAR